MDKIAGIVGTDEFNQAESMESLVWSFRKMRWNKVVPWTFHEAFFPQTLGEMKKQQQQQKIAFIYW